MTDLALLEAELATMRSRFHEAMETLEELSRVQMQFSQLSQAQQALEEYLASTALRDQNQAALTEQVSQLRQVLESKYEFFQMRVEHLQAEVDRNTHNLTLNLQDIHQAIADLETATPDQSTVLEKLAWLENSIHNLDRLVYADHSLLGVLEQRVSRLRQTTNRVMLSGFVVAGVLLLAMVWLTR